MPCSRVEYAAAKSSGFSKHVERTIAERLRPLTCQVAWGDRPLELLSKALARERLNRLT